MTDIDELVETLARDATVVKSAPHPFMLSIKWMAGAAIYLASRAGDYVVGETIAVDGGIAHASLAAGPS